MVVVYREDQTISYHSVLNIRPLEIGEEEDCTMAKTEQVRLTPEKVDVEYDERGDALYIAFSPDTVADDSELTDNDVLVRYKDNKIIGLTILHFSKRQRKVSS